jgi:uncharacterized protein (UPF0332 family)
MTKEPPRTLARSRQELEAAGVLVREGFGEQAVSRAYFAAFFAAEAALLVLGETRSKHSGVISAFGKRVVREGGVDESAGRLLRSLFERRNQADYGSASMTLQEAEVAVRDAEQFVDAVAAWIENEAGRGRDEPN